MRHPDSPEARGGLRRLLVGDPEKRHAQDVQRLQQERGEDDMLTVLRDIRRHTAKTRAWAGWCFAALIVIAALLAYMAFVGITITDIKPS